MGFLSDVTGGKVKDPFSGGDNSNISATVLGGATGYLGNQLLKYSKGDQSALSFRLGQNEEGAIMGTLTGAAAGFVVGGPVGAVIGGAAGGAAGYSQANRARRAGIDAEKKATSARRKLVTAEMGLRDQTDQRIAATSKRSGSSNMGFLGENVFSNNGGSKGGSSSSGTF